MSTPLDLKGIRVPVHTKLNIIQDFGAPIRIIQNRTATDARVSFGDGEDFVIEAETTDFFDFGLIGPIYTSAELYVFVG